MKGRFLLFFLIVIGTTSTCWAQDQPKVDAATNIMTNKKIDSLIASSIMSLEAVDYAKSLDDLRLARNLSKEIGNIKQVGLTTATIARLYIELNQFESAQEENDKAIASQRKTGDSIGVAHSYLTAATLAKVRRDYNRSSQFLTKAENIFTPFDQPHAKAKVYFEQGELSLLTQNFEQALERLNKAIPLFKLEQNSYYLARCYQQKSQALFELNRITEADATLKEGITISSTLNNVVLDRSYKATEAKIASKLGDYKRAFARLNDLQASDTLEENTSGTNNTIPFNRSSARDISEQLVLDIAREKDISAKAMRITWILGLLIVSTLVLLSLSLYRNNNVRGKANDLLQERNTDLLTAKENAEKATAIKAQFLSTITHELRTPMYAVTGLTHLLLSENPTEEQKKHLDSLKFSGEYLLSLINNILDLNKLEANKVEVEETTFNLRKRVKDVMFALDSSAADKGNKLKLEFDEDIPENLVGDPLLISQVLINLIGNAIKFTRDGHVHTSIQKVSQTEDAIQLHFKIKDTGEGISKKKQGTIFQSFTQGSATINRKFGGTGLGLSIVKNLLDLVGSKIELESVLGQGSTFSFTMAYKIIEKDANAADHVTSYDIDYAALENKHILVVEDNKINQMITRKILEKNSITCEVADNGEMAVDMVLKNRYDLILMDIHMPGITGIEATEKIREFNTQIPILALTAVTLDESTERFYEVGFNDIIPKPYKIEEFFQKIYRGLQESESIY